VPEGLECVPSLGNTNGGEDEEDLCDNLLLPTWDVKGSFRSVNYQLSPYQIFIYNQANPAVSGLFTRLSGKKSHSRPPQYLRVSESYLWLD